VTAKIVRVSGTPQRHVEHAFAYENTFAREALQDGTVRLRVGIQSGHADILCALTAKLSAPYRILYVLHTSRTAAPLGRYESPDLERDTVEDILRQFGRFLSEDARHDVWVHSLADNATVVLDRFNMVSAYGPLERFENALREQGLTEVAPWVVPAVPYPHALHYHDEWDAAETELLNLLQWHRKPLRDEDVQFWSGPHVS
jgi:hypothetical protein